MDLFKRLAFKGVRPSSFATTLALMLGSQQGFAQIPVTVTTQVTDSPVTVAEFAANTTRWAQQVQQMTSQIDQMKQQYGALTRSRGHVVSVEYSMTRSCESICPKTGRLCMTQ